MKHIFTLLLLVPVLLHAQTDEKYMANRVPVVDGKVTFTREIDVKDFSQNQIYTALLEWSKEKFQGENSRILYSNEEEGTIAAIGADKFKAKVGLFPAIVNIQYLFTINCTDGECKLTTNRIKYTNNPSCKLSTDILTAEEYITDKYALNKDKTKMFRGMGDYRISTIDIVDSLAIAAQNAVMDYYKVIMNNTQVQNQVALQAQNQVQPPVQNQIQPQVQNRNITQEQPAATPQTKNMESVSYDAMKSITPSEIPEELVKAVGQGEVYITAVDDRPLANAIAAKAGLDISSDKAAAMISVTSNVDNILYLLEKADTYTLTLFNPEADKSNEPVLILKCRKNQQFDKMFIGEIIETSIR